MSSIKEFKKEINYIFGEVIDEASFKQLINPEVDEQKVEAIIDEAVAAYDDYYAKISQGRKAENKKAYFKQVREAYEASVKSLLEKVDAL